MIIPPVAATRAAVFLVSAGIPNRKGSIAGSGLSVNYYFKENQNSLFYWLRSNAVRGIISAPTVLPT
jgi:hypothetical protein